MHENHDETMKICNHLDLIGYLVDAKSLNAGLSEVCSVLFLLYSDNFKPKDQHKIKENS